MNLGKVFVTRPHEVSTSAFDSTGLLCVATFQYLFITCLLRAGTALLRVPTCYLFLLLVFRKLEKDREGSRRFEKVREGSRRPEKVREGKRRCANVIRCKGKLQQPHVF